MTNNKDQAAFRKRRKAQGLVRVEVWVPEKYRELIKWLARYVTRLVAKGTQK